MREAKKLKDEIIKNEKCQVMLFQTKRGFHFKLIFKKEINQKECFEIRNKYGDCSDRLKMSIKRSRMPEVPTDILFVRKNNNWRKRVW